MTTPATQLYDRLAPWCAFSLTADTPPKLNVRPFAGGWLTEADKAEIRAVRDDLVEIVQTVGECCPRRCPGMATDGCQGYPQPLPKPTSMNEIDPWGTPTIWTCKRKGD